MNDVYTVVNEIKEEVQNLAREIRELREELGPKPQKSSEPKQDKDLLSFREISQEYSIPLNDIRIWASERKFQLYKPSVKGIMVKRKDFENWLRENHPELLGQ